MLSRRELLKRMVLLWGMSIIPLGRRGWAVALGEAGSRRKRLVVLFQRGAVDGLNVVVPFSEPAYYDARPTIAIPEPGGPGGALDLDGNFGLHPALSALHPLWKEGHLAFVHACGSPDPTRSHFDAQDYMESGTPGVKKTPDGWMNRLLSVLPGPHEPTRAVSFGPALPRILSGRLSVATLPAGKNAAKGLPLDRPPVMEAFDRLYDGDDALGRSYREGQAARRKLLESLKEEMKAADRGAPSPGGFLETMGRVAQLINRDPSVQLVFLDVGGWDTHIQQGAGQGQLANHLKPLGEGLAELARRLGPNFSDTVVLVISEFGRTARENGNGGTDHGHGNVMGLMGGNLRGRRIYGQWPGLAEEDLYEGRDLAVTTDFRHVIAALLRQHMGLNEQAIKAVFPGLPADRDDLRGLIKA